MGVQFVFYKNITVSPQNCRRQKDDMKDVPLSNLAKCNQMAASIWLHLLLVNYGEAISSSLSVAKHKRAAMCREKKWNYSLYTFLIIHVKTATCFGYTYVAIIWLEP